MDDGGDVTPADLDVIAEDAAALRDRPDRFAVEFYATLFDLDPRLRRLFPDDMRLQQQKLFDELGVLVDRAGNASTPAELDAFADRARSLGERHEVYGVTAGMYETVRVALLAALRTTIDGFDDDHELAWNRLYLLVAASMRRA